MLDLKAEIDGVATALKDIARGLQTQLQKLRSHARHEPAVIEGVMVNMQGEGQVRLGDLAHVVGNVGSGKSRGIGVVVYEQAVSLGSSFFSRDERSFTMLMEFCGGRTSNGSFRR